MFGLSKHTHPNIFIKEENKDLRIIFDGSKLQKKQNG